MSGSEAEDEVIISLKVKTTTQAYDISVKSTASISSVKDILTTVVENATKEQLCLIFSGKILKDHETLKMHNIGDGMAIHLVVRQGQTRRSPNQTTSNQHEVNNTRQETRSNTGSSIFSGVGGIPQLEQGGAGMQGMAQQIMNNPEIMRQMMDSPIMQNIMGNPDVFRSILANNPQIQQLVERNPELGHVLNDPDMMRQTMEMIRNPNMFQEMMRSHDLAIRNLQGIPGGEAALQRLYQDVQEPLLNSATSSLAGNPFASLRQTENNSSSRSQRAGQENSEALPNPWGNNGATPAQGSVARRPDGIGSLLGSTGMDSLMQQMMSDPNTMQSLLSPEMMNIFRQNMEQNPQLVQQVMESNPFVANNPQLAEQLRAQLPNMMNLMSNPEMMSAMTNPRVLEALRQVQQGMETIRREAPAIASMFTGMPGADIGVSATPIGVQNPTTQTRGTGSTAAANLDPNAFNILNNMFAGMSTGEGGTSILSENPEEVYAAQLEQLAGMGFNNRAQNIAALRASFGDLNAAVERLLNSP